MSNAAMEEERRLVERILANDRRAFLEFTHRYQRLIYHVVARMVPKVSDREEVCQTVLVRAYAGLAGFTYEAKLSTWLARIAFRSCLNHLQRSRPLTIAEWQGEEGAEAAIERVPDGAVSQLSTLMTRQAVHLMHQEIMSLPLAQRTAVTLFHLEEMSLAEIAQVMGAPEGTVKSHLFRARQAMKQRLLGRITAEDFS